MELGADGDHRFTREHGGVDDLRAVVNITAAFHDQIGGVDQFLDGVGIILQGESGKFGRISPRKNPCRTHIGGPRENGQKPAGDESGAHHPDASGCIKMEG